MLSCVLVVPNKPNLLSIDHDISWPTGPETLSPLGTIVRNEANLPRTGRNGRQVARPDYAKQTQSPQGEGRDKYFTRKELWLIARIRGLTKQSQFAGPDADRLVPNKPNLPQMASEDHRQEPALSVANGPEALTMPPVPGKRAKQSQFALHAAPRRRRLAGPKTLSPLGTIVRNEANLPRTGRNGRRVARPDCAKQSQSLRSESRDKYFVGKGLW
jgi:hypothetical protein